MKLISPRDIIKAFLTSGISVSMKGDEDSLSPNVMRLRAQVVEDKILFQADPEDLRGFYKDEYASQEDFESFRSRYNSKCH